MTTAASAFLCASDLPQRWRHRDRFVILDASVSGCRMFLAARQAWRADAQRCARLHFIAILTKMPTRSELAAEIRGLEGADELARAWPPATANWHRLTFDDGHIQLLLAHAKAATWWREIVADVDAFFFDEDPTEPGLLMRAPRAAKAMARLAAPAATLVASRLDRDAMQGLRAAGFQVQAPIVADPAALIGVRYEPDYRPRRAVGRHRAARVVEERALIVGAGLAGCAAAWALAEQGWRCTLLERQASVAAEASGNPAALFHGIVNRQDGTHARFNRAAALRAQVEVATAIDQHDVAGNASGLLQLVDADQSVTHMRRVLERLNLPETYVRALDARAASALAGLRLDRPAWYYPGGGWVQPAAYACSFLQRAERLLDVRLSQDVVALRRDGNIWQLLDAAGSVIEQAGTVVLANAGEALRLAGSASTVERLASSVSAGESFASGLLPVEKVRGQISLLPITPALRTCLPQLPIVGAGYLLPEVDGQLIFGATSAAGDDDPTVRSSDHTHNLGQLAQLAPGLDVQNHIALAHLSGRTAWRWTSRDRLPLIGAVPLRHDGASSRIDQPRLIPRESGLFLYTALGSRGVTWAALGAQVLASMVTGAPAPVEASLLDAVDPARFIARGNRR